MKELQHLWKSIGNSTTENTIIIRHKYTQYRSSGYDIIKLTSNHKKLYFASMGLIGTPGIIDKADDENSMPLLMREGMITSY